MLFWPPLEHYRSTRSVGARIVDDERTLDEIFKLRFRRYVLEQGKLYDGVDATHGLLVEELDQNAVHLADMVHGQVAAALRMSFLGHVGDGGYLTELGQALVGRYPENLIICSRFVMNDSSASLRSMVSLFRLAYRIGLESGAQFSALSTRGALVDHFTIFGYRKTNDEFTHPVSGQQIVMVLNLHDYGYLETIRSPLFSVHREWNRGGHSV